MLWGGVGVIKLKPYEKKLKKNVEEIFADEKMIGYKRHTFRVVELCRYIGKNEGANLEILIPAAYLHDIGRVILKDLKGHVEKSVYLAKILLKNIKHYEKFIQKIIIVIKEHHNDILPSTLEGKIVYDADKLELVGEVGITRWFMSVAENLTPKKAADEYLSLLKMVRKNRETFFITKTGKKLGDKAFYYSIDFCNKLLERLNIDKIK